MVLGQLAFHGFDALLAAGQLGLVGLHRLGELLLLDLELEGDDAQVLLELLVLVAGVLQLAGAARQLVLAVGHLAAKDVDVLLLGGHDLDEVLLGGELLQQQVVDGGAVLTLLLEHGLLGLVEAPQQVVHLHLQALQLHVLLVEAVLDREQLALADVPDLRDAGDLRLARP